MNEGEGGMDLDRRAADAWFRRRGLPMVIHRRRRGAGMLRRSTPGLMFLCLLDLLLAGLVRLLDVPRTCSRPGCARPVSPTSSACWR
ncbi:hypothetical protein [Amycolatopsis sp. BJA-103]|uniref:hypothetical protein n=1 Tax=Amycolatopsis sp. BJA-103 TaxID=1911175 RepID=UPI001E40256E|nr:hypothetical protein [Amycolatopsis sp. BJA-103]